MSPHVSAPEGELPEVGVDHTRRFARAGFWCADANPPGAWLRRRCQRRRDRLRSSFLCWLAARSGTVGVSPCLQP